MNANDIRDAIKTQAGIVNGNLGNVPVWFDVKEMQEKVGSSVYRTKPSGRFQINVSVPGSRRERIFRTKKADGSFDLFGIVEVLQIQAAARLREINAESARQSNVQAAELIRGEFKSKTRYVSGYASSTSSFVAPSATEGKVAVQINFGSVSPEAAMKIAAFVNSLEA
jgi:hypothetical protein